MLFFIALVCLQACFVTAVTPRYAARHGPDKMGLSRSSPAMTTTIPSTRSTIYTVTCITPYRTSILECTPTISAHKSLSHFKGTRSVTRTRTVQLHSASPVSSVSLLRSKVSYSATTVTGSVSSVNKVDGTTKATGTHLGSAQITSLSALATPSSHSANEVSNAGAFNKAQSRTGAIIGLGCIWGVFGVF